MKESYLFEEDLAQRIEVPEDGTLSVTICDSESCKAVLFGFATGQELSEHTASVPATLQMISGNALWSLGSRQVEAKPGAWAYLQAGLPHAVAAQEPSVMLLILHRNK
ncbi:MAG TPA: cupin domain-containing protein [Acidobacteriota bacterium]|nr:cupin domain-containing protein [Acidobacteriota bacterium]